MPHKDPVELKGDLISARTKRERKKEKNYLLFFFRDFILGIMKVVHSSVQMNSFQF